MKRTALLISLLLGLTGGMAAQTSSNTAATAASSVTVIGCVVGLNGSYTLTNGGDKQYRLEGNSIAPYSGQKVRATGAISYSKSGSAESTVIDAKHPTLTVSRMDKLADACTVGK